MKKLPFKLIPPTFAANMCGSKTLRLNFSQWIRETLMPEGETSTVEPGQPFHLGIISHMAQQAGDPDWRYPPEAGQGVPLGVRGGLGTL